MKTSQSTVANSSAALGRSGLGSSAGQRLPVPPRERKPALAALAVLLILGGALTSAYLVIASGKRVSAIQISRPVAAGRQIPLSALREVPVGDTGVAFINWSERAKVAKAYAAVPLVEGTLLTNKMTAPADTSARGRVVIGLALKPGQFPAGLQEGLRVSLYAVGTTTSAGPKPGTLLSADAIVNGVRAGGDSRLRGDQMMIDVAVPPGEAPLLTQAASAGSVAVALVPDGTKVGAPAGSTKPDTTGGQGTTQGGQKPTNPAGG